ncbi:hypothetical protein CLAFUW4_00110 [Fulvia fulva]|uniref:Uncharacterized protein n=1 Tax=Passalora fulva TaxID=5499 RepID=A0A9Q8L5E0_PASFU|nr:uncharacterized protein CLAFUR5_00109 [Fulvia fulva]KAK4634779.1 hypothetical protein CLAFUR4_00110 [Fulvia fulva]KAK4638568.1 hypothetical protein CLAFUR0_00108 [Fulvia fulva]UJO11141.1 hypothetical protein CLAFUR5_00109 [Fulvia fulva]WPV10311.1 hypothetical protein CLAFUW4_00110 [Fulvia fulva]WPV23910.1 hypothetical protein CLAFUW7_00110 [Fulvia fulva]
MTTFLIQAEQEYSTAKAALVAAGVQPPGSHIESGFVDNVDDGYRISEECDITGCVDIKRIESWLADLPDIELSAHDTEDESAAEPGDIDRWDFVEVALWESRSMVAEGAARRRIDKWRAQAAACAPAIRCRGSEDGSEV